MNCIDPSVTDENDPCSIEPTLDPLASANGFTPYPDITRYAPPFIERYRAAQRIRVERIDLRAETLIAERMAAKLRSKASANRTDALRGP